MDLEICKEFIKRGGPLNNIANTKLKESKEFVKESILINSMSYTEIQGELTQDRELALLAAKEGLMLDQFNEKFRDDKEIVLLSLITFPSYYQFASERLQKDPEVMKIAREAKVLGVA